VVQPRSHRRPLQQQRQDYGYKLLRGSRIEITTNAAVTTYELSFPDDENMVWSLRKGEKVVPSVRWRR
jgi:hypothetical protein